MFLLVPSTNDRGIYQQNFGQGFHSPVNWGNISNSGMSGVGSGLAGLGIDWDAISRSVTDTASSVIRARYGQPQLPPGTTVQRRANPQTGVIEEILVRSDGSIVGGVAQIPAGIATTGFTGGFLGGINPNVLLLGVGAVVLILVLKKR